jgi:hypothetical protein
MEAQKFGEKKRRTHQRDGHPARQSSAPVFRKVWEKFDGNSPGTGL